MLRRHAPAACRLLGLLGLVAALSVAVVGFGSATASAAPAPSSTAVLASTLPVGQGTLTNPPFICASSTKPGTSGTVSATTAQDYLPINRWSSAAGELHSNLSGGFFGLSNLTETVQRGGIETAALEAGNTMWRAATGLVGTATSFCIGDTLGLKINSFTATLGNAVIHSGLVAALLAVAVLITLWRVARGRGHSWKSLGASVFALGLLIAMVAGSEAGITNNGSSQLSFGTMSPAWMISTTFGVVNAVASLPAKAFDTAANNLGSLAGNGPLSCGPYVRELRHEYAASYGPTATDQLGASLPLALDSMWEQTGLEAYAGTQFGPSDPYSADTYCRLLESNAGNTTAEVALTKEAVARYDPAYSATVDTANASATAFAPVDGATNNAVYRSIVGWAACRMTKSGGWTVNSGWAGVKNPSDGNQITSSTCSKWFGSSSSTSGTALGWDGVSATSIAQHTQGSPGVGQFLLTFIGNSEAAGFATSILYLVASLVVFVCFAVLALAIIIAKVALLVLGMLAVIVVLIAIIPSSGMGNKAVSVAKHAFGMVVFATAAQAVVSLVAVVTGAIITVGSGSGAFVGILFTSFAPVAAIVLLHLLFTKVLRAPSPFKASSALAYGAAFGGIGYELASGVDRRFSGAQNRALGTARGQTLGRLNSSFGAPRPERAGGMSPTASRSAALAERSGRGGAPAGNPTSGPGPTVDPGGMPGGSPETAPDPFVVPDEDRSSGAGSTGTPTGNPTTGPGPTADPFVVPDEDRSSGAGSTGTPSGGPRTGPDPAAAPGGNPRPGPDPTEAGGAPGPNPSGPGPRPGPPGPGPTVSPQQSAPEATWAAAAGAAGVGAAAAAAPVSRSQRLAEDARHERLGRQAVRQAAGGRVGQVRQEVRSRAAAAAERARTRPLRTAMAAAGVGAAAAFVPFAAPVMAAGYAAHKASQWRNERRLDAGTRRQAHVAAGRAAQAARDRETFEQQRRVDHDEAVAAQSAGIDLPSYGAARRAGASSDDVLAAHAAGVHLGGYAMARGAGLDHEETLAAHTSGWRLDHYARVRQTGATREETGEAFTSGIPLHLYARGRTMGISHGDLMDVHASGSPLEEYLEARRPTWTDPPAPTAG